MADKDSHNYHHKQAEGKEGELQADLLRRDQQRKENPYKTAPTNLTRKDKARGKKGFASGSVEQDFPEEDTFKV